MVDMRAGCRRRADQEGSFVASMLTVVSTLKYQQRHVFAYLTAACEAALRREAAPSLLPARHPRMQAAA
jgi:hypothetical protein